jgi:hypothetical protein
MELQGCFERKCGYLNLPEDRQSILDFGRFFVHRYGERLKNCQNQKDEAWVFVAISKRLQKSVLFYPTIDAFL